MNRLYNMPLFRPPSEADSLIIQVTLGCSHNKCTFCDMYKSKDFFIKPIDQIKKEIDLFRENTREAKRIFLADGDALIIEFNMLCEILKYIKEKFPECNRISMYGSPKSILLKNSEELKILKSLGVFLIYLGIESGDDELLKFINKGVTSSEILAAGLKVKASKIKLSVTVIAGLGGREFQKGHIVNTGKIISAMCPEYFSILTLMYSKNTEIYKAILEGKFTPLESHEVLEEIREILLNTNVESNVIFRSNHASNYVDLGGNLPKDKNSIIEKIQWTLANKRFISDKYRGL